MTVQQRLDSSWRVDVGRVRTNNEDAVDGYEPEEPAVRAERGCLYVVADGMGGHAAGEVASNYAVQSILHHYYTGAWDGVGATLVAAIRHANQDIHEEGARNPERRGMGSTVVAAAVHDDRAVIAHAGDSRAYLLRDGQIRQLTSDHTWVAERLADGTITPEEAENHPNRNVLTRNLGSRLDVDADVTEVALQRGDRLLLCSDGLWGALPDQQIAAIAGAGPAERVVTALVSASNAAGGPDNIGVALINVGGGSGATTRRLTPIVAEPSWQRVAAGAGSRRPVGNGLLTALGRNKPAVAVVGVLLLAVLLSFLTLKLTKGSSATTPVPTGTTIAGTAPGIGTARPSVTRTTTATASPTPPPPGNGQYLVVAGDTLEGIHGKCAADGVERDPYYEAIYQANTALEGNPQNVKIGQTLQLPVALTRTGPICNGGATPIPTPSPPPTAAPATTPVPARTQTPPQPPTARPQNPGAAPPSTQPPATVAATATPPAIDGGAGATAVRRTPPPTPPARTPTAPAGGSTVVPAAASQAPPVTQPPTTQPPASPSPSTPTRTPQLENPNASPADPAPPPGGSQPIATQVAAVGRRHR